MANCIGKLGDDKQTEAELPLFEKEINNTYGLLDELTRVVDSLEDKFTAVLLAAPVDLAEKDPLTCGGAPVLDMMGVIQSKIRRNLVQIKSYKERCVL